MQWLQEKGETVGNGLILLCLCFPLDQYGMEKYTILSLPKLKSLLPVLVKVKGNCRIMNIFNHIIPLPLVNNTWSTSRVVLWTSAHKTAIGGRVENSGMGMSAHWVRLISFPKIDIYVDIRFTVQITVLCTPALRSDVDIRPRSRDSLVCKSGACLRNTLLPVEDSPFLCQQK